MKPHMVPESFRFPRLDIRQLYDSWWGGYNFIVDEQDPIDPSKAKKAFGSNVKTSASFVTLYSKVTSIVAATAATTATATSALTADTPPTDAIATTTKRKKNATNTDAIAAMKKKARAPKIVGRPLDSAVVMEDAL